MIPAGDLILTVQWMHFVCEGGSVNGNVEVSIFESTYKVNISNLLYCERLLTIILVII